MTHSRHTFDTLLTHSRLTFNTLSTHSQPTFDPLSTHSRHPLDTPPLQHTHTHTHTLSLPYTHLCASIKKTLNTRSLHCRHAAWRRWCPRRRSRGTSEGAPEDLLHVSRRSQFSSNGTISCGQRRTQVTAESKVCPTLCVFANQIPNQYTRKKNSRKKSGSDGTGQEA